MIRSERVVSRVQSYKKIATINISEVLVFMGINKRKLVSKNKIIVIKMCVLIG